MPEPKPKPEFDDKVMQANFSAILYLLTEQQYLIGKLLQALLDNSFLNSQQLDRITDISSGKDGLIPTYAQLYNRFAHYYLRTKELLEDGDALDRALKEALGEKGQPRKDKDDE